MSSTQFLTGSGCRPEEVQIVHLTDTDDSDEDVQIVGWVPPREHQPSQTTKRPSGSPLGDARRPAKMARARDFSPAGFQLEGVKIIHSKSREGDSLYLVQWVAKPHITTWLKEEEVATHFPQACRQHLANLAHASPKRLAHLARGAGPISKFL